MDLRRLALGAVALQASALQPIRSAARGTALRAGDGSLEGETFQSPTYYSDALCAEDECELPSGDQFMIGILGDLHLDPRKMEDYEEGRSHFLPLIEDAKTRGVGTCVVSLGDLGESKSVCPAETTELFAGTTACHTLAADFLGSFGTDYEVIGGNHDLEGIDEFSTDAENLEVFCKLHGKPHAQFLREIADKTLLVGLGSTVFRTAKYTSHEVTIDDAQIAWFEDVVRSHPSAEGWKIFVFTHAPPIGSGLRVLQANHVVNGCCWLNHSGSAQKRNKFIELVREHRCIKAWFSGHFHLGQDYEDSITLPTAGANRGSCIFAQTSVMRTGASRDGRRQSRLVRGNAEGFEICTVDHKAGGRIRLDATVTYTDKDTEAGIMAHGHDEIDAMGDSFVKVYAPSEGDDSEKTYNEDGILDATDGRAVDATTTAWWKMACGRVLGINDNRLIEYDASTLAPLGLVVGADELQGRQVLVVASGNDEACQISTTLGMEGADCAEEDGSEQAVLLVNDADGSITVVQPNEDGSFWRKIVRNKIVRMKEKRRVEAAARLSAQVFKDKMEEEEKPTVFSSWGPYTQISGTAKSTAVPGVTIKRAPSRTSANANA